MDKKENAMLVSSAGIALHPQGVYYGCNRHRKRTRGNSTSGRSKGIVVKTLQRWACKRNRAHKHAEYDIAMAGIGRRAVA